MLVMDPVTGNLVNPYFLNGTPQILDMLTIWKGGLGIPGAVIGGALALYIFCRRKKVSFLLWADIAAPGVALAQAIGRFGNYFNQEVYGKPTTLPWAVHIDPIYRVLGYENYSTFHPLFLYESIWNLMNMGFLLWMSRKFEGKLKEGDVFLSYVVGYSVGRFLLEFLRLDAPLLGTININQTFMLIVALVSGFLIFWRHRKGAVKGGDARVQP
jgi:phosphatidylglycerol:prolipoprotein diacylglycerol transferase